jgi:hypothetical protein
VAFEQSTSGDQSNVSFPFPLAEGTPSVAGNFNSRRAAAEDEDFGRPLFAWKLPLLIGCLQKG